MCNYLHRWQRAAYGQRMAFSINTNVTSLEAQSYLLKSSQFQAQTINEVTSGLRIVNSGDDAAGLAIANGFRSDEAMLNQGIQNANNGLATLQTIDSGMNNISTLLDRARTLATESASGTFSGSRGTLDSEYQSVIGEVSRQAQAIGMNAGGEFAQALSVFVGGGKGITSQGATANGTLSLDLTKSAVDAGSLGLQGVQAEGNATVDLSATSASSVKNLISDATNQSSEAIPGYTSFTFKGPGFSDGSAIGVSVNLAGVTDAQSLATAINTAIQSAGAVATQAATAFRNANVTASIVADASGGQHLALTAGGAAFEVQAGDRTANALLGNIAPGVTTTGASLLTTYGGVNLADTAATTASQNTTISLQFQGAGLTYPDTLSFVVSKGETLAAVLSNVTNVVSLDAGLRTAGITVAASSATGRPLTFQSTSGQQFSVTAGGDVEGLLGLGTAQLSASGLVQYGTTTAATPYNAATATNTEGIANFEFSFNGQASSLNAIPINLAGGDATAGSNTGTDANPTVDTSANKNLSLKIDGTTYMIALGTDVPLASSPTATKRNIALDITDQLAAKGSLATATVNSGNQIVITSGSKGAGSSVQILTAASNDAAATLGLTGSGTQGTSESGTSIAANLNVGIAANATLAAAGLQASYDVIAHELTISSSNNTNFQLNAFGSSTGASLTGTNAGTFATAAFTGSGAAITPANDNLTVILNGSSYRVALTPGVNSTLSQIAADINGAVGVAIATVANNTLTLTSNMAGANGNVSIGAGASSDASVTLGLVNANAVAGTATPTAGSLTGTAVGPVQITGANHELDLTLDGAANPTVVDLNLGSNTMLQIASTINALANTASVDGSGHLVITSTTIGVNSTVAVNVPGANSGLGLLTAGARSAVFNIGPTNDRLSLAIDSVAQPTITLTAGAAVSAGNLALDINTQLRNAGVAGIIASVSNGAIALTDTSPGSSHSLQVITGGAGDVSGVIGFIGTSVSGTDANVGFGFKGASFTGNTQSAAILASPDLLPGGAYQTPSISFSPLANGADNQSVTLTTTDAGGVNHVSTVVLHNNTNTSQSGATIDSAVNAINSSLQQSADASLESIVAVKYNYSGTEKIRFISAYNQFSLTVGKTGSGAGLSGQGTTVNAAVTGIGITTDIGTQAGALLAVNALADAVQTLGSAQAVVGKSENNLNFAMSLAQSQTTNEAAADSQIRDANLAQQAANLTKAQILMQAGTAALSQANSAPQALLALLK